MRTQKRQGREDNTSGHGGKRAQAARRYGIPREEFLDFSASINLLGPPAAALGAVRTAVGEIAHYPEEDAAGLTEAIADQIGVMPQEVVLGNGSTEIIYWLAAVLKAKKVLIVEPTFSEYRRASLAAGSSCDSWLLDEKDGFAFDAGRLDPSGYDLVFVCNPNNPTGYLAPLDDIDYLWRKCRAAGTALAVDEAFIDFADPAESIISLGVSEGLYVIRSLTKVYALAGLRLGFLAASEDFARKLQSRMPPWNINSFALAAGKAAFSDNEYLERTIRETAEARGGLSADLYDLPRLEPLPSEVNYLLCRLEKVRSDELAGRMAKQGILIRDCGTFMGLGDRYIRVAVRSERENYQLVSALRKELWTLGSRQ